MCAGASHAQGQQGSATRYHWRYTDPITLEPIHRWSKTPGERLEAVLLVTERYGPIGVWQWNAPAPAGLEDRP